MIPNFAPVDDAILHATARRQSAMASLIISIAANKYASDAFTAAASRYY